MMLCVGPTPAIQRVMVFPKLTVDAVNRATQTIEGIAGKSVNVAKVLRSLGEPVLATGFAGGERGNQLLAALTSKKVDAEFVMVRTETRQCTTVIDKEAGAITELVEESQEVPTSAYEELKAVIARRIKGCPALIMSGTVTPGGPKDFYLWCTKIAKAAGALTVVDAQGPALVEALKANPGLIKPNRSELAATVGRELRDEAAVLSAIQELHARGAGHVVITAGKQPTVASDGEHAWRIKSPHITPVNPIGSGDSFTAALVSRLVRGDNLGEACRWAAAAGAANALTLMAGEVNAEDVQRLVSEVRVERM